MKKNFKRTIAVLGIMAMVTGIFSGAALERSAEGTNVKAAESDDSWKYESVVNVQGDVVYRGDIADKAAYFFRPDGSIRMHDITKVDPRYYNDYDHLNNAIVEDNSSGWDVKNDEFWEAYGKYAITRYSKTANKYGFYSPYDLDHPNGKHFKDCINKSTYGVLGLYHVYSLKPGC